MVPEILRAKIGVFVDLYRKTTELERLNRTLEERVSRSGRRSSRRSIAQLRESEHRLRLQGEALAEADRRKNEFLAMLAHELRNPLQPIRTAVELLRQPKATPEQLQWARDVIDRQVDQLVRLVDDLLDASRISSGKLELRKDAVDLVPIIAGAVESIRSLAERKQQRIDASLPSEPVYVDGDAVRLTQVFLNLLNNAVKYTPEPAAASRSPSRCATATSSRAFATMASASAEPTCRAVFEMFYQGKTPQPTKRRAVSASGLALVRQLVQLHGGTVRRAQRRSRPRAANSWCGCLRVRGDRRARRPLPQIRSPQRARPAAHSRRRRQSRRGRNAGDDAAARRQRGRHRVRRRGRRSRPPQNFSPTSF